jgi:hypothetical protein
LFLVSLVPWIDKSWGNTLREKLHDPVRLQYINWGAKERLQDDTYIDDGVVAPVASVVQGQDDDFFI